MDEKDKATKSTNRVKIWKKKKSNQKGQSNVNSIPPNRIDRNKNSQNTTNTYKETFVSRDNLSKDMRRNIMKSQVVEGGKNSKRADYRYRFLQNKKIIAVVLFFIGVIILFNIYGSMRQYHNYQVIWQTAQTQMNAGYESFENGILAYGKDGVSLLDSRGIVLWQNAYTMNAPTLSLGGEYALIYDKEGTTFYIYDEEGCIGEGSSNRSIMKAVISSSGVVATIQEENTGGYNYISYYNNDGSSLDIEIRTTLSDSGYPLDIDISPDGTALMASYVHMDAGSINNQIVFYNFEVGKNDSKRTVGGFADYNQMLIPRIAFLGNDLSVAFADSRIDFYSLKNAQNPERKKSYDLEGREIKSIFYDKNVILYTSSGKKCLEKSINFDYNQIKISGKSIILINDTCCRIYNLKGRLIYEGSFEMDSVIKDVVYISNKTYLVSTSELAEVIKFK
jgi:hypothetical protein